MNIINEKAKIGANTKLGNFITIEADVKIGKNCIIGNNVTIYKGSTIGDFVRIDDNTVIGKQPMRSPRSIFKAEKKDLPPAKISSECIIGTNVVIYAKCIIGEKNLIADLATIRENVELGDQNIVGRGVAIENFCKIGSRNKFETNSYITAYSEVADDCFVAPGVITSNDNYMARDKERYEHFKGATLKNGSRIGANATILPGKVLKEDATIAAGAVVSRDVPKEEIWAGVPAKYFRKVPEKQLLKNNK